VCLPLSVRAERHDRGSQSLRLVNSSGHYSPTPSSQIITNELLRRGAVTENIERSPFNSGLATGCMLSLVYIIWVYWLQYGMLPSAAVISTFLLVHTISRPQRSCPSRRNSIFSRFLRACVGLYGVLRPGDVRDANERCFEAGKKQFSPNNVLTNGCHIYLIHG
jgi:hypothetical protein